MVTILKDILPFAVITEINSSTLEFAKRFQAASPICDVTVIVDGMNEKHEVVTEIEISLTAAHTLKVTSNGPDRGGIYAINGGFSVSVENGESMVIGVYQQEEEVGAFRITGS